MITATVRPAPGRVRPVVEAEAPAQVAPPLGASPTPATAAAEPRAKTARTTPRHAPEGIEPGRKRRIARGREAIARRLDLHGLDQDRARARLLAFLLDAQDEGARAVLVITGKGYAGQGVLKRRTPEWLADPALRDVVAGLSPAEDHHGGGGAYYIALKRKRV